MTITEETEEFEATFRASIRSSNPEGAARRQREKQLDFGFMAAVIVAIVVVIVAASS